MTIEEKARAYDEALEDMRVIYPNLKGDAKLAVEHAFPQLRESEDEQALRIIKKRMCYDPVPISDEDRRIVENWLEKQKEQKPVQRAEEKEFVRTIKSIIADFIRDKKPEDVGYYQRIYDWLDGRHIEQKPVEWSEEDEKTLEAIEMHLDNCGNTGMANALRELHSCFYHKDCDGCSKHLEGYISGRADAENKLLEMYGILLMPDGELRMKPRWKPSEEQMRQLHYALTPGSVFDCDILNELYEQLKKL